MRNKNKLQLEQLGQKLSLFIPASTLVVPSKGWIHSIRTTLNMTMEQLGNKLGITKQGVKNIENRETNGSASINSLKEVAKVLDMQFVYGFVPKDGTLDNLVEKQANKLATKIVMRTHQNMKLESQEIEGSKLKQTIAELSEEIKRDLRKSLWD